MKNMLWMLSGASRGYGRCIAEVVAESYGEKSNLSFVLFARGFDGLEKTSRQIHRIAPNSSVFTIQTDLSQLHFTRTMFHQLNKDLEWNKFHQISYIHCAAQIGSLNFIHEWKQSFEIEKFQSFLSTNVVSPMMLTSELLNSTRNLSRICTKLTFIHISSLAALHPFKSMAQYCS